MRHRRDHRDRIAEIIREAALEGVHDELPHSIAVTIDDMVEREDKDLIDIYANLFVERDSQKGIIIGKGGERLQDVGAPRAREIEPLMARHGVSVAAREGREGWQRDPKQLAPGLLDLDERRSHLHDVPGPVARVGPRLHGSVIVHDVHE